MLINQFVPPTFCLYFAFTGINLRDMLDHVCDVPMTERCVDQSEPVNVGAQIKYAMEYSIHRKKGKCRLFHFCSVIIWI